VGNAFLLEVSDGIRPDDPAKKRAIMHQIRPIATSVITILSCLCAQFPVSIASRGIDVIPTSWDDSLVTVSETDNIQTVPRTSPGYIPSWHSSRKEAQPNDDHLLSTRSSKPSRWCAPEKGKHRIGSPGYASGRATNQVPNDRTSGRAVDSDPNSEDIIPNERHDYSEVELYRRTAERLRRVFGRTEAKNGTSQSKRPLTSIYELLDEGTGSPEGGGFPGCGKAPLNSHTKESAEGYIINGAKVRYGRFPQYVRVIASFDGWQTFCGGTLVSDQAVLTAAHCVSPEEPNSGPGIFTTVFADDYVDRMDQYEFRVGVKEVCFAPNFNSETVRYDWALLKLERPVEFNAYVQPACLPRPDQKITTRGKSAVCYGLGQGAIGTRWGWGGRVIQYPSRFLRGMVAENVPCQTEFAPIDVDRVCYAGFGGWPSDTCYGDSGGPMLCLDAQKRWTLMGILSGGPEMCDNPPASYYTRVRNIVTDIQTTCKVDL